MLRLSACTCSACRPEGQPVLRMTGRLPVPPAPECRKARRRSAGLSHDAFEDCRTEKAGDLPPTELLSPQVQARAQSVALSVHYFFLLSEQHPFFLVSSFLGSFLVQQPFFSDMADFHLLGTIAFGIEALSLTQVECIRQAHRCQAYNLIVHDRYEWFRRRAMI